MLPKRRDGAYLIESIDEETLVYDRKRHKAHCLNATAAAVWQHCDGRTTVDRIASAVQKETGIAANDDMVRVALARLGRAGLLDDSAWWCAELVRFTRRDALRKLGIAATLVPFVMTVVAPTPALAVTSCSSSAQCASGCCCNDNSAGRKNTCVPGPFPGICNVCI